MPRHWRCQWQENITCHWNDHIPSANSVLWFGWSMWWSNDRFGVRNGHLSSRNGHFWCPSDTSLQKQTNHPPSCEIPPTLHTFTFNQPIIELNSNRNRRAFVKIYAETSETTKRNTQRNYPDCKSLVGLCFCNKCKKMEQLWKKQEKK